MFPQSYKFDFIPFIKEEEFSEVHSKQILDYWNKYHQTNVPCVSVYYDDKEIGLILFCKTKPVPCSVETSCLAKTIMVDNKYRFNVIHGK